MQSPKERRERSISPSKRSLFSQPPRPEPREHDSLDKLEQQVQILGDIHFHEVLVEKALKDFVSCLHELSETELKLAHEMKKLQPYAQFNIWGNLFFEVGECHRELQELRSDLSEQIESKVLQSLKTPRNSGERQRVRKRLAQHAKKFRELSTKRAALAHHKDVTSQDLIASLRLEAVELQLQRDAMTYAAAYNAQQHHALLNNIAQTFAVAHRYHERSCVRLLELQPMWRELQGASFGPPAEDILVWIAEHVPDEPPSLTRSISQRLMGSSGSPRHKLRVHKTSANASPNGSPREVKLSPRQLEKQPMPPPPAASPAPSSETITPAPLIEPIDSSTAPNSTTQPPPVHSAVTRVASPPSSSSPRSVGSSISRNVLQRRIADLENALRDVRTAVEKLQTTAPNDELRGALQNVLLLASPPSPRSAAAGGLPPNLALSQAGSVRSSITVPATTARSSRSAKRLSVDPGLYETNQLVQLLGAMPPNITQTSTFQRLAQLVPDFKPSTSPLSPSTSTQRQVTAVPSAPSTALQLHKLKTVADDVTPRRSSLPQQSSNASNLKELFAHLLLEMKRESEFNPAQ